MVMEGNIVIVMLPHSATAKPSEDFALCNLKKISQTKLFIELYTVYEEYITVVFLFFGKEKRNRLLVAKKSNAIPHKNIITNYSRNGFDHWIMSLLGEHEWLQ
jgi:hypothetical protein